MCAATPRPTAITNTPTGTTASRWLAAALGLALLLAGGAQLVGGIYRDVAENSRWRLDFGRSRAAAEVAATLQSGPARALAGRVASAQGQGEDTLATYRAVLRDAPADAYRWAELARSLAGTGQFGAEFDQACRRAQALAPVSPAVHAVLAGVAWRYWNFLSVEQRTLLFRSLRRTIRNGTERQRLLEAVVRERRQRAFCAEFLYPAGAGSWCERLDGELAACAQPKKLTPHKQRWCKRVGALPP